MSNIQKYQPTYPSLSVKEQAHIQNLLLTEYDKLIQIGDYLIDNTHGVDGKVVDIKLVQRKQWKKEVKNGERDFEMIDNIIIYYQKEDRDDISTLDCYQHLKGHFIWKGTLDELKEGALGYLTEGIKDIDSSKEQQQAGLISFNKEAFVTLKESMVLKAEAAQAKMAVLRNMLDQKRWQLQEILKPLLAEVKRITTIIWTIELYLGIKENIQLIIDGVETSIDEPIHLMQERLYIDEEVGDPSDDGIDFRTIDKFYDWLDETSSYYKFKNYELFLPYKKCVRITRIRREGKEYSSNPFVNSMMNDSNFETLLLIRNGEKIYSIETDMRFGEKLFPAQDELMNLSMRIRGEYEEDEHGFHRSKPTEEDLTKEIDRYKRNLIIIQGLIDRTEVFGNIFGKVNLMNGTAIDKEQIIFHYDSDKSSQIGDGDYSWSQRMIEMRKQMGEGSRVLFFRSRDTWNDSSKEYRFFRNYSWRKNYPPSPNSIGPYDLLYDKEYKTLYFMFLPDQEIWDEESREYRQRTKRYAYRAEDDEIYDIDFLSWRDVNWIEKMIYDRRERRFYLSNISKMMKMMKIKQREIEEETPFAQLIQGQCNVDYETAMDAIHWWKTKNKYKRSLTVDDSKAFRMIKKHLSNEEHN